MKNSSFIWLLVCICFLTLSCKNVFAEYPHTTVPVEYNGKNYDYYFSVTDDSGNGLRYNYIFSGYSGHVERDEANHRYLVYFYSQGGMMKINDGGWSDYGAGNFLLGFYDDDYHPIAKCATNFPEISTEVIPQLSVILNPQEGGTVTGMPGILSCTDGTCTGTFSGNETLTATPAENYAFAFWDNGVTTITDNPYVITMNGNKTLTAKFFKTFRNAAGNFQITTGDECVIYVRNETEIPYDACHGEAADCFDQAQAAGYATGSIPRDGAIIVFDRVPGTALDVGHVAIVTGHSGNDISMHDSNWVGYHTIGNHTETIGTGGYSIKGYIYYAP